MSTVRRPLATASWIPKKASAYGANIADGESGWKTTVWGGEPTMPKPDVQRGSTTGRSHEYNDEVRLINGWDTRLKRSFDLDAFLGAWMAAFGLGAVSSADAGSGGTRHTFKPLDISSNAPQLPDTAIVENYPDESLKQKILGLVVDSFQVSGQKGAWLQGGFEAIGNGKIDTATALSVPALTTATPFRFAQASLADYDPDGGANRSLLTRLRGFNFQWNNNLLAADGYLAGGTAWNSGFLRSRCELGNRQNSGHLTLTLEASRAAQLELSELLGSTLIENVTLTFKAALIGGSVYEEFKIVIPQSRIDEIGDPTWEDDVKVIPVRLVPEYDTGISAPLKIEVVNTVSTWLSAAA